MIYKFLGSGGVCPLPSRHLTSLYVQHNTAQILIDCGEGIQTAAKKYDCTLYNLDAIFISHFHADHTLGLPGLLTTLSNNGRTKPLMIYGPNGVAEMVSKAIRLIYTPNFCVMPIELQPNDTVCLEAMTISPIELEHGVVCYGYAIVVRRPPSYKEEIVQKAGLSSNVIAAAQSGYRIKFNNILLDENRIFGEDRDQKKLIYATDTGYCESLMTSCVDADVAILEGCYGTSAQIPKTEKAGRIHMTFEQAATIASKAGAKQLILTHFSPTMPNPDMYLQQARNIFPNTVCAYGGMCNFEEYKQSSSIQIISVSRAVFDGIVRTGRGFVSVPTYSAGDKSACILTASGRNTSLQMQVRSICRIVNNELTSLSNYSEAATVCNGYYVLYMELVRMRDVQMIREEG